jgi:hypothetical protein
MTNEKEQSASAVSSLDITTIEDMMGDDTKREGYGDGIEAAAGGYEDGSRTIAGDIADREDQETMREFDIALRKDDVGPPSFGLEGEDAIIDRCGLPRYLIHGTLSKPRIVVYVKMYVKNLMSLTGLKLTPFERDSYEHYSRVVRHRRSSKMFFVAALRLFRGGYSLKKAAMPDLHSMAVQSDS